MHNETGSFYNIGKIWLHISSGIISDFIKFHSCLVACSTWMRGFTSKTKFLSFLTKRCSTFPAFLYLTCGLYRYKNKYTNNSKPDTLQPKYSTVYKSISCKLWRNINEDNEAEYRTRYRNCWHLLSQISINSA